MTFTLPGLLMTAGLSSCAASNKDDAYVVLSRFDPDVTTLTIESARNAAQYAKSTVEITPGKYCQTFVQPLFKGDATGRTELSLLGQKGYMLASRFTYKELVRRHLEFGKYQTKGHALILSSYAGTERIMALSSATGKQLNIWGELPLNTGSCASGVLKDAALRSELDRALKEQNRDYPWE